MAGFIYWILILWNLKVLAQESIVSIKKKQTKPTNKQTPLL